MLRNPGTVSTGGWTGPLSMLSDVSTLSFSPARAQKASFSEGRGLPSATHSPAVEGRQVPPRLARRVLTEAGRASGSGRLGRRFQTGGRRAWAGCGSSALATQLSPRCTSFPQRPGTSHVKASQRLGGSELRSGKWRCPVSIPQAGTALPPEPFNREWESMSWKFPTLGNQVVNLPDL